VRQVEGSVLDGEGDELDEIEASLAAGDARLLVRQLAAYHRRRERAAGAILRALYRAP
jgi:hypothetical protein